MDKEVYPLEVIVTMGGFRNNLDKLKAARDKVKQMELWAPQLPKELGGVGIGFMGYAICCEEIGRSPIGPYIFGSQAPDAGNIEILEKYATPEQREKYLHPLINGDIRSCFSMTEPEFAGSNPTQMATSAVKDGDDYVINGHKWYTSSADGAKFAIVMANTNPESQSPYAKASMIIVPTDTPGFDLVRNISVMGHAGDDYASHGEIMYANCRVPQSNLLGPEGQGFIIAQERLGPGRIHHCMRYVGIAQRSFEIMCQYAATREVTPGKTLAAKQIIQEWVADSRAKIHASRLMVLHAAWKIDTQGAYEAREEISLIKFYVANVMLEVIDRGIQIMGGLGVSDDNPLSHFYRMERGARIYDGADEVHKVVVAKRIFRQYQK
jgi:alkylation response protein AidB-like acyl-CoA dehydrogenase